VQTRPAGRRIKVLLRRDGEVITKTVQLGGIQSVASLRMAEYAAGGLRPQDDDQDQDTDDGSDEDEEGEDEPDQDEPDKEDDSQEDEEPERQ